MTIGVAIIGSGLFAKGHHLPAINACSSLTLKAVYSRSFKSAKELSEDAGNVDVYSDDAGEGKSYRDLLARSDIHAVILALPIMNQPEYVEEALSAGKHVLSEKPIAGDFKRAQELIKFYNTKIDKSKTTWGVAENFRFLDAYVYGAEEAKKLGRVIGFKATVFEHTRIGTKYYETGWRKNPTHQGGFLIDGGIHSVAGMRFLLGSDTPSSVSAYTLQSKEHLPPVDTINAIWKTKGGASGVFAMSYGSSLTASELTVACEKGSVTVAKGVVTVREGDEDQGKASTKDFSKDQGSGVTQEVAAWAKALEAGKPNPNQSPEEALADLEIMEKMLRSGEADGKPMTLEHQI